MKKISHILFFIIIVHVAHAKKQLDYAIIEQITISGNAKTKDKVIIRELSYQIGDTILLNELEEARIESEYLLMNTGLFSAVNIAHHLIPIEPTQYTVDIIITVKENWYFYPAPLFEIADRNFNVWWTEQKRSLDRVKYGGELAHINFTGNNDRLKLNTKFGYTKSFSLKYNKPGINRAQTLGLSTNISFSKFREVNYLTQKNKQVFHREDDFIYQRFFSSISFTYRPELRVFHEFHLQFSQDKVDTLIANQLNPNFFPNNADRQSAISFKYQLTIDQTDIKPYPLNGYRIRAEIFKNGFGFFNDVNGLYISGAYSRYFPIGRNWFSAFKLKSKVSIIRTQQPYKENRSLGFGSDNLSGFSFYIVDGLDMYYAQSSIKYQLFERKLDFGKLVPIKSFRVMPIKAFFTLNNDVGYVNGPFSKIENPLNNRLLWGGGIGLDLIFYYDKVLQIQYSINDLLEKGLFLSFELNI